MHSGQLANGYEQTKWVADALVTLARSRGVPSVTYRVGLATGNSQTGVYEKLDEFLPRMIKGCIQLGMAPTLAGETIVVPIDYLASAMVAAARDPRALNDTFHLDDPSPMMLEATDRVGQPSRVSAAQRPISETGAEA